MSLVWAYNFRVYKVASMDTWNTNIIARSRVHGAKMFPMFNCRPTLIYNTDVCQLVSAAGRCCLSRAEVSVKTLISSAGEGLPTRSFGHDSTSFKKKRRHRLAPQPSVNLAAEAGWRYRRVDTNAGAEPYIPLWCWRCRGYVTWGNKHTVPCWRFSRYVARCHCADEKPTIPTAIVEIIKRYTYWLFLSIWLSNVCCFGYSFLK